LKLRSTSFAEKNFADEITWIKNKAKSGDMAVLELMFRNVSLGIGRKFDPATGVTD